MDKKKLFKKFLNNQCNSQEAELVSQLLMEEPHLLDELLSEEEWDNYLEEYEQSTVKKGMSWKKVFLLLVILVFHPSCTSTTSRISILTWLFPLMKIFSLMLLIRMSR